MEQIPGRLGSEGESDNAELASKLVDLALADTSQFMALFANALQQMVTRSVIQQLRDQLEAQFAVMEEELMRPFKERG
ncbi:hypothetical protein ACFLWX_03685 [Chloroflexota bacterium]